MIGWAEETAWISHPTSIRRDMSRHRIVKRRLWSGPLARRTRGSCTGWTEGVEVDFMIDTGCQVTILATSVFERMCVSDPQVRSQLHPCDRWLVSADSSLLTVHGERNMTVVFPGLSCDIIPVVANIGSDGLLGTKIM